MRIENEGREETITKSTRHRNNDQVPKDAQITTAMKTFEGATAEINGVLAIHTERDKNLYLIWSVLNWVLLS